MQSVAHQQVVDALGDWRLLHPATIDETGTARDGISSPLDHAWESQLCTEGMAPSAAALPVEVTSAIDAAPARKDNLLMLQGRWCVAHVQLRRTTRV